MRLLHDRAKSISSCSFVYDLLYGAGYESDPEIVYMPGHVFATNCHTIAYTDPAANPRPEASHESVHGSLPRTWLRMAVRLGQPNGHTDR